MLTCNVGFIKGGGKRIRSVTRSDHQPTVSSRVCEQKKDIKKQENQSETVTNFILNYAQDVVRASSDKSKILLKLAILSQEVGI